MPKTNPNRKGIEPLVGLLEEASTGYHEISQPYSCCLSALLVPYVILAEEAHGWHKRHWQWKARLGDRPAQVPLISTP